VCLNISTVIHIKILTNSNLQTQSFKFTSHISAFLSVVLITEMLEIPTDILSTESNTPFVVGIGILLVLLELSTQLGHCCIKYYNVKH
jgi:hypothetical protein